MNRRAWLGAVLAAPLLALVGPMLPKEEVFWSEGIIELLDLSETDVWWTEGVEEDIVRLFCARERSPYWRWAVTGDKYAPHLRGIGYWCPVEPGL